jgi:hypothetical protein
LSFIVVLVAAIEEDLGDGSVHNYPHGKDPGKEVMHDVPAPKILRKKKGAKHAQRHVKEDTAESPYETVPMYLDMDDVPL